MRDCAGYPLRAVPVTPPPVERLIVGKQVDEAAALLPRIFNLCRTAQEIAARAAFGLPLAARWQDALRTEIIRQHVMKLCLEWPSLLSLPAIPLPRDWQTNHDALRSAMFGPESALPQNLDAFNHWLASGNGASQTLRAISARFAPGEAVRKPSPTANAQHVFKPLAQENSAAARQAAHPILRQIEAHWGRGPLWSATGVAVDLEAQLDGAEPQTSLKDGRAVVPAARGFYGVKARVQRGKVIFFKRITPTDHLLSEGGALAQSLATLPQRKAAALAPLVLSILDPCHQVELEPATAREPAHA
ncbi:MAG: hydrogenase expression/formation protein HupK [Pseudomonadota bacterium]